MKDSYFIIHGSFSSPYSNWFGWLYEKLTSTNKTTYAPAFPTGLKYQNFNNWSKLLDYYNDLGLINENTTFIAHSIGPIFIIKYLITRKIKVKKLILVCGFNNYLGINDDYDTVNKTMYLDNIADIKQCCNDIICLYTDNDPYVNIKTEASFATEVGTTIKVISQGGHLNKEAGYDRFEEILKYIN